MKLTTLAKNKNFYKIKSTMHYYKKVNFNDFLLKSSIINESNARLLQEERRKESLRNVVIIGKLNFDVLLNGIEANVILKSHDLLNFNDNNFSKIYFFLNRLYKGIFSITNFFSFKKPVLLRKKQLKHLNKLKAETKNILCNFVYKIRKKNKLKEAMQEQLFSKSLNNKNVELENFLSHTIYFMFLIAKLRQIPKRTSFSYEGKTKNNLINKKNDESIIKKVKVVDKFGFTFLDITTLVAGTAAFKLFHDYFDWNKVQLLVQFYNSIRRGCEINSKEQVTQKFLFFNFITMFRFGNMSKEAKRKIINF